MKPNRALRVWLQRVSARLARNYSSLGWGASTKIISAPPKFKALPLIIQQKLSDSIHGWNLFLVDLITFKHLFSINYERAIVPDRISCRSFLII